MPQSLVAMFAHVVFSTKNRRPMISSAIQPRLHAYIGGIIRGESGALLTIGGMPDHLHLLISMSRTVSLSDLIRLVKSNSSKWIHETWVDHEFAWQSGYGAFSVSKSQLPKVSTYIDTQESHHRDMQYQDEFRGLLRRHGIEWGERYVWD